MLGVFSNVGDQSSSTVLEIIWSKPTLHFFEVCHHACIVLRKGLFQILVNFCEGSVKGSERFCTVLLSPNFFFGITQANVCIKLCNPT